MRTVSVSGDRLRLALSRSMPDIPGMMRSVINTETGSRRMISSASPPDPAVSTRNDSRSKILCNESTMPGSSSTIRTVGASFIESMPHSASTLVPSSAVQHNKLILLAPCLRQLDPDGVIAAKLSARQENHPTSCQSVTSVRA